MRLFGLLLVLATAAVPAAAQTAIGLRTGFAASTFRGEGALFVGDYRDHPLDGYERVVQPEVAVVVDVPITARLALRPEVAFARRGGRQSITTADGSRGRIHTIEADYAQALVAVTYRLPADIRLGAGVYGGAVLATRARVYNRYGGGVSTPGTDVGSVETVRSLDAGVVSWAALPFGPTYAVDLRYARGLTPVTASASAEGSGPVNDALSLGLTIRF